MVLGGESGIPLQYSYLENSHRQRSLVGYSPWCLKELDMKHLLPISLMFIDLFSAHSLAPVRFVLTDSYNSVFDTIFMVFRKEWE